MLRHLARSGAGLLVTFISATTLLAQTAEHTQEQLQAAYEAHRATSTTSSATGRSPASGTTAHSVGSGARSGSPRAPSSLTNTG